MHDNSIVVIVPIGMESQAIALSGALGHSAHFAQELSANGDEPATHKIMHAWGTDGFAAIMSQQVSFDIPGASQGDIDNFFAAIVVDVRKAIKAVDHVNAVLIDAGLVRINGGEPT